MSEGVDDANVERPVKDGRRKREGNGSEVSEVVG